MYGMHQLTGQKLYRNKHLNQSIEHILKTPKGQVVGCRNFGSTLYQYLDQPITEALKLDITSSITEALARWEKRFLLKKVHIRQEYSHLKIQVLGQSLIDQKAVVMEVNL